MWVVVVYIFLNKCLELSQNKLPLRLFFQIYTKFLRYAKNEDPLKCQEAF